LGCAKTASTHTDLARLAGFAITDDGKIKLLAQKLVSQMGINLGGIVYECV
jgi:hypothetical protein